MQNLITSDYRNAPRWIKNYKGDGYREVCRTIISQITWVFLRIPRKPVCAFIELDEQNLVFQYEFSKDEDYEVLTNAVKQRLSQRSTGDNSNLPILIYESRPYSWNNTYNGRNPEAPEKSVFRLYWNGGKKIELVEGEISTEGGNRIDRMQGSTKFELSGLTQMIKHAKEWEFLEECMREAPGGVLEDYGPWRRANGMGCCIQLFGIGTVFTVCALGASGFLF